MDVQGLVQQLLRNNDPGKTIGSRVWNLVKDAFLASAVFKATSSLLCIENIVRFVNFCLHIVGLGYNTITIVGIPTKKNPKSEIEKEDFSIRFKALLYQLRKSGHSKAGVHQLVEGVDPESDIDSFIVSQTTTFTLAPTVFCTVSKEKIPPKYSWEEEKESKNFRAEVFSRHKNIDELEEIIVSWIKEYKEHILKNGENMITLIGIKKKGYNETFDFSNRFLSVVHKLKTLDLNLPSIKLLTEIQLKEPPKDRYSRKEEEEETLCEEALVPAICFIEKDIQCRVEWKTDKDQFTEYSIQIFSEIISTADLMTQIDKWEKEYNDYNQIGDGLKYFVFNSSQDNKKTNYAEFCFDSKMSFRNIFFPEKQNLIEKINFFQKNENWFTDRGIPYTFGLLLHGEPGCGKASVIKAIANMTSRHIISVPLKNVKTSSELYSIFFGAKYNTKALDMDKRLYVLEDIDCGGFEDIVKRRINTSSENGNTEERMRNTEQKEQKMSKGEITLSDILEVFDGVMETKVIVEYLLNFDFTNSLQGRMMIITTNHLNKLDPALTRPGRVDTCLELKRCKPEAIMAIFKAFYGEGNIPEDFSLEQVHFCYNIKVLAKNMLHRFQGMCLLQQRWSRSL